MHLPKNFKLFFLLPIVSAALLTLAWPPLPFTCLIFIAFVPLCIAENMLDEASVKHKTLKAWLIAFIAFSFWNIGTTWWISATYLGTHEIGSIVAGAFSNIANAAFMTMPFMLSRYTKKWLGERMGYIAFICYWMSFEYLHLRWELAWPWLNLGNAFALNHAWVQWYAYTGTCGGTLWILIINMLVVYFFNKYIFAKSSGNKNVTTHTGKYKLLAAILCSILIPIGLSLYMYYHTTDKGNPVQVVIVQPNIDSYKEKFILPYNVQLNKIINLAKEKVNDSTDYLVMPETAIPDGNIDIDYLPYQKPIRLFKQFSDQYPNMTSIIGINGRLVYRNKKDATITSVQYIQQKYSNDTLWVDEFNTAIQIDTGKSIAYYNKSKLVPGVERMPYPAFFKFLEPLTINLGGITGSMGTQKERTVFRNKNGVGVAPVICYESIFGEYVSRYIKNGADLIFIITNDGWWANTAGHKQHCYYASLRAIENRRCIARSANTGTSCFINQRGDISDATDWATDAVISKTIYANSKLTFYTEHGDLLARIALCGAACLYIVTLLKRLKIKFKIRKHES